MFSIFIFFATYDRKIAFWQCQKFWGLGSPLEMPPPYFIFPSRELAELAPLQLRPCWVFHVHYVTVKVGQSISQSISQ